MAVTGQRAILSGVVFLVVVLGLIAVASIVLPHRQRNRELKVAVVLSIRQYDRNPPLR
jgi:hypothetical protein